MIKSRETPSWLKSPPLMTHADNVVMEKLTVHIGLPAADAPGGIK